MEENQSIWTKDFIGITVINLLSFFGFQILLPTLPIHVKSLGGSDSVIGWLTGVATIASLLIRPFSGMVLDKFGRKGVLLAGLAEIIFVTLGYMLFPVVGIILACRFLHGMGWGAANTASNTVATDMIPKQRFGEGMGYFSLSTSIAMALGPGIGLAVLAEYHITGLTLLSVGFGATALVLSLFIHYRTVEPKQATERKRAPYERSSLRPTVIMFFVSATYGSITGFLSLYAMERGIANIGAFFLVMASTMLLSRPLFGRLVDRLGFGAAVYPGLIVLEAAMVFLYQASVLPLFLIAALCYGVGFGALQSSLQTMAVIRAPKERLGAANATFFTGFDGGIGFGSVVAGMVASTLGYNRMYLAFSVFLLIALILYLWLQIKQNKSYIKQGGIRE